MRYIGRWLKIHNEDVNFGKVFIYALVSILYQSLKSSPIANKLFYTVYGPSVLFNIFSVKHDIAQRSNFYCSKTFVYVYHVYQ